MTRDEIREKVIDIVAERLEKPREQIREEASMQDDLGADSLDIAEIVMEFEDEFDLQVPEDQTGGIKTIGEAIDYIVKAKGEKKDGDGSADGVTGR